MVTRGGSSETVHVQVVGGRDVVEGVRELVGSARADRYWVLSEASSAAFAVTFVQDSNIPQIQRLAELKPFK